MGRSGSVVEEGKEGVFEKEGRSAESGGLWVACGGGLLDAVNEEEVEEEVEEEEDMVGVVDEVET